MLAANLKSALQQNRLLVGSILLSCFVISYLALEIRASNEAELHSQVQQKHVLYAEELALRLQSHFARDAQSVQTLIPFVSAYSGTPRDLRRILPRSFLTLQSQYVRSISMIDASGAVVYSTDSGARGPESISYQNQSWIVVPHHDHVGEECYQQHSHCASVYYIAPYSPAGSPGQSGSSSVGTPPAGKLIVRFDLSSLIAQSLLELSSEATNSHVWIIDSDSRLIFDTAHPDSLMRQRSGIDSDCARCHSRIQQPGEIFNQSAAHDEFNLGGERATLAAYGSVNIGNLHWKVFVGTPLREAMDYSSTWNLYHFIVIGLLAYVFLGGSIVIGRSVRAARRAEEEARRFRISKDITEKIFEANRHVQSLVENVHDIVWIFDREGRFLYANHRAKQFSGYSGKQWRTNGFAELVYEADLRNAWRSFHNVLSGQTVNLIVRLTAHDGSLKTLHVNATPYYEGETIAGTICFGRDVTHERHQDAALRRKGDLERRVTTISTRLVNVRAEEIDAVFHGALADIAEFVRADRAYLFLYSDDQEHISNTHEWCREGVEPQKDLMQHVSSQIFPWFNARILNNEVVAIKRLEDLPDEAIAEKEGLSAQQITSLIGVPMMHRGSVSGFVGFDSVQREIGWGEDDITLLKLIGNMFASVLDRVRQDQELRMFERAIQSTSEAISITNLQGELLYFNDAFVETYGYSRDELVGKDISVVVAKTSAETQRTINAHTLRGGWRGELENRRKDGSIFPIILSTSVVMGETGQPEKLLGVARDISEMKCAENNLRRSVETESLLNTISSKFLTVQYENIDAAIYEALRQIGLFCDADRAYVFVIEEAEVTMGNTHEWCAEGIKPQNQELQGLPISSFPWWMKKLSEGKIFQVTRTSELGHEAMAERNVFQRGHIKSVLGFPALYRKKVVGFVGLDAVRREKEWSDEELRLIEVASKIIFSAIEQSRSAATLRASEQKFRAIIEGTKAMLLTADRRGCITYANDATFAETGWSRKEIYGKHFLRLVHPADREQAFKTIVSQEAGRLENSHIECRYLKSDNREGWISVYVSMTFEKDLGAVIVAQDITSQRIAQQRLLQQAALIDISPDAITVRSLNNEILFWSKGAEKLYGWSEQEVLGKRADEILPGRRRAQFPRIIKELLEQGVWSGEVVHTTKSGKEITVEARWVLVKNEQGNPTFILAVHSDISEKKSIEHQLLRAQRLESLGTLAGGIAHDLNNILAPILMSVDLLRQRASDAQTMRILDTVESTSQRGADIIKQVLTFARGIEGERGTIEPRRIVMEIEKVIRQVFPRSIDIEVSIDDSLPPIQANPTQMHQVLMNLCLNARDAMPSGGQLAISASLVTLDEKAASKHLEAVAGNYLRLSVRDSGVGIPHDHLHRIFDPFFTTKAFGKGSGLGLSTASSIVKSHQGFISVESEAGAGTEFSVYFPIPSDVVRRSAGHERPDPPSGNGELVLVVDDEESILDLAKETLEANGYRVLTASNGVEAVMTYAQHQDEIDLVFTDLMMPLMDGYSAMKSIRAIRPNAKFVTTSGNSPTESLFGVGDDTVDCTLNKPYAARDLLDAVARVLNN